MNLTTDYFVERLLTSAVYCIDECRTEPVRNLILLALDSQLYKRLGCFTAAIAND